MKRLLNIIISVCLLALPARANDVIEDVEVINAAPVPVIVIQGDTAYMHVNVTAGDSYDPDKDKLSYYWDYGDGHISEDENPKSYYYETPGEKTITLTVTDEFGLFATTEEIFVAKEKGGSSSNNSSEEITIPPEYLISYEKESVIIDRVLPNPDGKDNGKEKIVLRNMTNQTIPLWGWKLVDAKETNKVLELMEIYPMSTLTIGQDIFKINLNNTNEELQLFDPLGNLMSEMTWDNANSGQWIKNFYFLHNKMPVSVMEVIDGDTIKIFTNEQSFTLRLIGVDTPETVHPSKPVEYFGYEASSYLRKLIQGRTVLLKFDQNKTDSYGRILAYVYLDALFVNAEIIRQGYGYAYTDYDFKYMEDFIMYEDMAAEDGLGLWKKNEIELVEGDVTEDVTEIVEIIEEVVQEVVAEEVVVSEVEPIIEEIHEECVSDNLLIDSFLPNPQKGQGVEYIRLVNSGSESICLNGWSLDDVEDGGSKQYVINGGSIASGAVRTFRKNETGLTLNNNNDCVILLNPFGEISDQICYGKTHKNEVFTHDGGDWVPKITSSSSSASFKKRVVKTTSRDPISYQYDFIEKDVEGDMEFIYEEGELMYISLDDEATIQVSYAGSSFDMNMAKQLIDLSQPIKVQYLEGENINQLVSIDQEIIYKEKPKEKPFNYFFLFPIIGIVFVPKLKSSQVKFRVRKIDY